MFPYRKKVGFFFFFFLFFASFRFSSGDDDGRSTIRPVKPLIEGSERPWTFKPPPSTLDGIDPSPFIAQHATVQAHLRKTHLLVDCAQTRVISQMEELEQLGTRAIVNFSRAVAERNRDMRLIGQAAEELAVQTTAAFNTLSRLVDLTLRVKQHLSPHEQTQLDRGSALYRLGRPGSRSSMALMLQLGTSARTDTANQSFWMEKALPRWQDVSVESKLKAARKGSGVPAPIRGQVWMRAIGNDLGVTAEEFAAAVAQTETAARGSESGPDEITTMIGHDVPRTFHRLELFVNPKESFTMDLVQVLEAFARTKGSPGYVQGMSYLAGLLLLNMSPFDAWVAMNNLIRGNHLFMSVFQMKVGGIVQHARIYEMLFSEELPDVYARLHDLKITSDHYLLDWFMTMFCRKLPLSLVARVWDLFLMGGEIELHKTAVAVVKTHKEAILSAPDFDSVFRVLTSPLDVPDENAFLTLCASVQVGSHWAHVLSKLEKEEDK